MKANQPDNCRLERQYRQALDSVKTGYEIVDASQLIPYWNDFLDTECPTVLEVELNGDEKSDYAVLIKNESYELVVILSTDNAYQVHTLLEIGFGVYDEGLGWGITRFADKRVNEEVDLENDGIHFMKFESSASVYYWDGSRFNRVWLAD
ncbi:MAG: hypothetical protein RIC80_14360 [Cyclobacteriaceae bacterium]